MRMSAKVIRMFQYVIFNRYVYELIGASPGRQRPSRMRERGSSMVTPVNERERELRER